MKHKLFPKILLLTAILSFTSLACLFSSAANLLSSKAGTIANLWSDVPKMDGLSKSNLDLPLYIYNCVFMESFWNTVRFQK